MAPVSSLLLVPMTLLTILSDVAASESGPVAVKKQLPDSNEKLLPQHLAFAPLPVLASSDAFAEYKADTDLTDATLQPHAPPFAVLDRHAQGNVLRRAAEALALLQRRTSCPAGMTSCDGIGSPNKCCASGTYCTLVPDVSVGQVACCPNGATCGGGIGSCPAGAASCAADLGGGCCIPGYVCQGYGCVPSASITVTSVVTSTAPPTTQTITATHTTIVAGSPSTVVVTLTLTQTAVPDPLTRTETQIVTAPRPPGTTLPESLPESSHSSAPSTAAGVPPWRPTAITSTQQVSTLPGPTQTGCPNGFYGCLASHGGGCCRTERDCDVLSCPAPSSTVVSHGVTVVVPASDVPAAATQTCASGWFMCGKEAGPRSGCCPSGYECGTASCFTTQASSTNKVQKEAPAKNAARRIVQGAGFVLGCALGSHLLALLV